MNEKRCYIAIDLKSFYASVECVDRGIDPLKARLVVADPTRTDKTICLAVSPALRAEGIPGRARLFEVKQKARDFIIAPPRMRRYMEVSTQVFAIYARYVALEDIHVYSVDEAFLDATSYLKSYKISAKKFATEIAASVYAETGIIATVGIGTNLYLAKVAMDIMAKHMSADVSGARIAELNEMTYRQSLWTHEPLTDFWRIGPGYARRLKKMGIYCMGDLARYSLTGSKQLYKEFGVNAELLIDHAWGYEPVEMKDIKNYTTDNHSLSIGQVLPRPYDYEQTRLIIWEMADALSLDLITKNLVTDQIVLTVIYASVNKKYELESQIAYYGRKMPDKLHGSINLDSFTNSGRRMCEKTLEFFDKTVERYLMARRIYLVANHVHFESAAQKKMRQLDIFTDYEKDEVDEAKEKRLRLAELEIKQRYGKNAILKLKNYEDGATMKERNRQVGGHHE